MENQKPIYKECSQGYDQDENDPLAFTGIGYEKITTYNTSGQFVVKTITHMLNGKVHNKFGPAVINLCIDGTRHKSWHIWGKNIYRRLGSILYDNQSQVDFITSQNALQYAVQLQMLEIYSIQDIMKLKKLSCQQ